jgi:hypothetical protein
MILGKFKLSLGLLLAGGLLAALLSHGLSRPYPLEPAARAAPDEAKKAASPAKGDTKAVEVSGRVIDAKGGPIAGAKVLLWGKAGKALPLAETGPDGHFRARVDRADRGAQTRLIARVPGRGADWVALGESSAGQLTLRLSEEVPVQGRVRDLEGRPIAGAIVKVNSVEKSATGDLNAYMDAWKNVMQGAPFPTLVGVSPAALGLPESTTTDREGRFTLRGCGREQQVELRIQGKGIEHQWLRLVTRPGLKKERSFHGPTFDLLVGPGKELVGVVKDKRSGEPVPGAVVTCQIGRVVTDARGNFRIEGLRKQSQYGLFASKQGYFTERGEVKDSPGREPVHLEVQLQKGLRVEGQLIDGATGKPVSGVVASFIKADNPHLKNYSFRQSISAATASAGPDGKFSILTIPGPGYLAVQADHNRYTRAALPRWDGTLVTASPYPLFPYYYHAAVAIDPDEKKPETLKCSIALDRGLSKEGSIVDPEGKLVKDTIVLGLTAIPDPGARTFPRPGRFGPPPPLRQKESTFTAVGLNPKDPRHLIFLHPERKLGKLLRLAGDEKGPLVVKLEPLGAVSGRALAEDGSAAEGRFAQIRPPSLFAFYKDYPIELLDMQNQRRGRGQQIRVMPEVVKTDAEGKFRLEGLIPGLKHDLWVTADASGMGGPSHVRQGVIVEAGKTKELGDVRRTRGF